MTLRPTIDRGGLLYELPAPILLFRIQDAWDFRRFKVPLKDGETVAGHSRDGVNIRIQGHTGTQAGGLLATEAQMFDELETLRQHLHVGGTAAPFTLHLFRDDTNTPVRNFQNCSTLRFDYDLSAKHLYTYSVVIHAAEAGIAA